MPNSINGIPRYVNEETIGLLTLTASKRAIIKELIPINLLIQKETMRVDFNDLTEKELDEAKVFIDLIKTTTPLAEILTVKDYRATGLVEAGDTVPEAGIETVKSLEDLIKATTPATN